MSDKLGEIKPYRKIVVIENGEFKEMYWDHPTRRDPIDMRKVQDQWLVLYPGVEHLNVPFLIQQKFSPIVDGVDVIRANESKKSAQSKS